MTLKRIISPEKRRKILKSLLNQKKIVRGIEVHNALSALIANDLKVEIKDSIDKKINEFDFFWESSLTDSASKGLPDIEMISFDSRLKTISEIFEVTNKPMIMDGDTGGDIHHFEYLIPRLEKIGVSAIIIEDKIFPKRNSLEGGVSQAQEDPEKFSTKIRAGKNIQISEDFMIIARIESLIAGKTVEDALKRAECYLQAGADGIMIHSKSKDPSEILEFANKYQNLCDKLNLKKPLIVVPTTYNSIYESELVNNGISVVIYANHMLRSAYKAMEEVGKIILKNERSFEAEPYISPLKQIFEKVGFLDIKEKDKLLSTTPSIIIPAAGENSELKHLLGDLPKTLINLGNKTILEHQISSFKKFGLNDINVVIGYQKEKFDKIHEKGINYFHNLEYYSTGILHSLMKAKEKMHKGFIYLSSDILLDSAMNLIDEAEKLVKNYEISIKTEVLLHESPYDKAISNYQEAKKLFQKIDWNEEAGRLINTIKFYKEKKEKDEKLRQLEKKKLEEPVTELVIAKDSTGKTLLAREKKILELEKIKKEKNEGAEKIFNEIHKAERMAQEYELKIKESIFDQDPPYDEILKIYREAKRRFEEIGWIEESMKLINTIKFYKEKYEKDNKLRAIEMAKVRKRDEELIGQQTR